MFEDVLLEPEQEALLARLIEAQESVPRDKRKKFYFTETKLGSFLVHPGLTDQNNDAYAGDLETLRDEGLLRESASRQGVRLFDVTPRGRQYYSTVKDREVAGTLRMEPTEESDLAKPIRAFLSYSHTDRERAAPVHRELSAFGMIPFMAHDDLGVSVAWRERILAELHAADVFIPLLSAAFKSSDWAPQEAGVAVAYGTDKLILPLSLDGAVPFGFINKWQGKLLPDGNWPPLDLVVEPILKRFTTRAIPGVIGRMRSAGSFRYAEEVVNLLVPYLDQFDQETARAFADAAIDNNQVWDAARCKADYLPRFLRQHHAVLTPERRSELQELLEG